MTETIEFEARKLRYSQSKDGMVVSFLIQPHDCPASLATADLGTIYIIRAQQTESGAWIEEQASASERPPTVHAAQQRLEETAAPSKPHRDWSSLPLSERCALRCKDGLFWKYIGVENEAEAVKYVKSVYLKIESRKQLDTEIAPASQWGRLDNNFQSWVTEREHGALIR